MKKQLNKSEIKELNKRLEKFKYFLNKKDKIEILDQKIILVNSEAEFFYYKNRLVPTLKLILKNNFLKTIAVDMGAIKFVVAGADIMRPGIVDMDDFEKDEIIVVVDQTHKKPLAIGVALYSSREINKMQKGKVVKNLHYVGDSIWSG